MTKHTNKSQRAVVDKKKKRAPCEKDDDDIAFEQRQRAERAAMKDLAQQLGKKGATLGTGMKKSKK